MSIRWKFFVSSLVFFIICGCHSRGSKSESAAPTPEAILVSQRTWCTVQTEEGATVGDERFDEILAFESGGDLKVLTAELDQFNRLKRNSAGKIETRVDQSLKFRVAGTKIYTSLPDDAERMSEFAMIDKDVDGKSTKCIELKDLKSTHCACDLGEKK